MANRLQYEQSPYLLQHAHNPVDWYPWCDEAFEKAKTENKPVLVSIGYSACHWCHVMERESFEDAEIATFMNNYFVCIKVDREEHPDVDQMYMDAVTAISGSGGWPLNVFVTPDRLPFYGGTYFPPRAGYNRPSWQQVLHRMGEIWYEEQTEATRQAEQMLQHLTQASKHSFSGVGTDCSKDDCRQIADDLLSRADKERGGFGNAPKFPGTMAISYLLEHYWATKYQPALDHALLSLEAMANGGINDQIGGGFARYSTDRDWLAPHFEKMLYDNALLISVYCDAYSITKNEKYKAVIENTIAFVERELNNGVGGYYCAIDADSEGVEGKFYTWGFDEFQATVGEGYDVAAAYFGVQEKGNWEKTNILHIAASIESVAEAHKIPIAEAVKIINNASEQLFSVRAKRIRPTTDDKSLLAWNALMNASLTKAGIAFDNPIYIERAKGHMEWMLSTYIDNGEILHTWKKGISKIAANLDDIAFLISALLQLASATGNNDLIIKAVSLVEGSIEGFFNKEDGFFYFTHKKQKDIPLRKVEVYDGATPSGNSYMAFNLMICGMCTENTSWLEIAEGMLRKIKSTTTKYSYSFGYWATIMQRVTLGIKTVVCAGKEAGNFRTDFLRKYLPQAYILTVEKEISELGLLEKKYFEDKNHIFVCSRHECQPPVNEVCKAVDMIERV